jgi:hypothetical protein
MKCLTILAAIVFVCTANVNGQDKNLMPAMGETPNLPYKIANKNVTLGNPAYAQKLLWIYKNYEDNNIDKIAETFDENIVGTMPDGTVVKGKAAMVRAFKEARESLASINLDIRACVVLKSPDMPDREAVTTWTLETDTAKDGTITKFYLNEVWFFNKQGKVIEGFGMVGKYGQ